MLTQLTTINVMDRFLRHSLYLKTECKPLVQLASGYCCQPLRRAGWQAVVCHTHIASCSIPRA